MASDSELIIFQDVDTEGFTKSTSVMWSVLVWGGELVAILGVTMVVDAGDERCLGSNVESGT